MTAILGLIGGCAKAARTIARLLLFMCIVSAVSACSPRPILQPRSEMLAEARARGIPVRTIEEDRAAFFSFEKEQRERLSAVIQQRRKLSKSDSSGYRLGPQDEIEVAVFEVAELSGSGVIADSGIVSLPLIGPFKAAGLTIHEATDRLETVYRRFVKNPRVSVSVKTYGSQRVGVMGAVEKPGVYPLTKRSSSVLEVLGQAGGFSEKAGNVLYFVPAESSGVSTNLDPARPVAAVRDGRAIQVYLDEITGSAGSLPVQLPLQGGDLLIVPEAGQVLVDGEVQKIGSFNLTPQSTLLTVLAAAGGITYSADIEQVEIVRELQMGNRVHLLVNLESVALGQEKDIRLKNGDLVIVPALESRRIRQDTFEAIQRMLNLGVGGSVRLGSQ